MLNGGIMGRCWIVIPIGACATWHLMKKAAGENHPPCTVTAEFAVKLTRPTPTNVPVHLSAVVVESTDHRAVVNAKLTANGKVCATCHGVFVAVKPGHPAYHRW